MAGGSNIWFFQQGISLSIAFWEFKLLSSVCRGEKTGIPSYGLNLASASYLSLLLPGDSVQKIIRPVAGVIVGGKNQQPDWPKCWLFKRVSWSPVDTQFFCGHKGRCTRERRGSASPVQGSPLRKGEGGSSNACHAWSHPGEVTEASFCSSLFSLVVFISYTVSWILSAQFRAKYCLLLMQKIQVVPRIAKENDGVL